jgi:hypothetical protein
MKNAKMIYHPSSLSISVAGKKKGNHDHFLLVSRPRDSHLQRNPQFNPCQDKPEGSELQSRNSIA